MAGVRLVPLLRNNAGLVPLLPQLPNPPPRLHPRPPPPRPTRPPPPRLQGAAARAPPGRRLPPLLPGHGARAPPRHRPAPARVVPGGEADRDTDGIAAAVAGGDGGAAGGGLPRLGYWIHRLLHTPWCYEKIHRVHHEFTAPMGYAAPYAQWAEVLVLGFPAFSGPVIVPCHMTTFWLWFVLRHLEAIDIHSGFKFPLNPIKYIPFYGGVEYHDYHHFVGGQSRSNFSSVFTFCDYIYGTDKGYRYHKASLLKEMAGNYVEKGEENGFDNRKQD